MTTRATNAAIDSACTALTGMLHDRGRLHRDSVILRGGAYGRSHAYITGGPHLGTGQEPVTVSGTRAEVLMSLHAAIRVLTVADRTRGVDR